MTIRRIYSFNNMPILKYNKEKKLKINKYNKEFEDFYEQKDTI